MRIVTLELAVDLFKRIVFYHRLQTTGTSSPSTIFLTDHQLALLEQSNEDVCHLLRQCYSSTDKSTFLELFEEEAKNFQAITRNDEDATPNRLSHIWSSNVNLSLEQLFMNPTLLLPPVDAPESNAFLRLPNLEYDETRYVSFSLENFFDFNRF